MAIKNLAAKSAYEAAEKLVAEALESGDTELDFNLEAYQHLTTLPPQISKLEKLEILDLAYTRIADIEPLAALAGLRIIVLESTKVSDLRPLLKSMRHATKNKPDDRAIYLTDTPALENDTRLAAIGSEEGTEKSFDAITAYLESLPQQIPDREDIESLREELAALKRQIKENSSEIAEITTGTRFLTTDLKHAQEQLQSFESNITERIETAETAFVDSIDAAKIAFTGKAAIAAPVELWKDKEDEHAGMRDTALQKFYVGLAFVVITAIALIFFLMFGAFDSFFQTSACVQSTSESGNGLRGLVSGWFGSTDQSAACDPSKLLTSSGFGGKILLIGGAILTIFTSLLWYTRLQLKLFLAERHMQMDARERRAFAQTYVGFLEHKDTSKEAQDQRGVVYGALFRPSSDGTIKDDGGMDPSISAAISKFLSKS